LGLALAASLWAAVTGAVILQAPTHGGPCPPTPPAQTIWDRVSDGAAALLHGGEKDRARAGQQALAGRLGLPAWRQAGLGGQGVKVAILDSGFRGYRAALGKVLPAQVTVRSFRKDGIEAKDSQHGILCAEVIHSLAPRAELLFANWEPEQPESFLQAVRWARQQGAQVISCSVIMPTWSDGEGRGAVHAALREALGGGARSGDGLFFSSAGNTAQRHWSGRARPDDAGWHQWRAGHTDNVLRPTCEDRVSVELTSCSPAAFDLVVRDTTLQRDVGAVRSQSVRGCNSAAVRFAPQRRHEYAVRVRLVKPDRARPPRFHLTVLGGKLQHAVRSGSIPFPGDGPEVVAVGAVSGRGRLFSYSSCGPNGAAAKPDLTAAVPFPSVWRPHQAFGGTSAAAPQAAALAAVLWSRSPAWTAGQVRQELAHAADKAGPGHSTAFGHGLLRLPALPR
jgi:subtilisin family serine protease